MTLTEEALGVLSEGKTVTMLVRQEAESPLPQRNQSQSDPSLFEVLRTLRTGLARREGVPAYIIFSNATLEDMARKKPKTIEEFSHVSGVGSIKAERFGPLFLKAIEEYLQGR